MKNKNLVSRDLSWLSFNARVLQEAADPRVPLLERLRFLAIYSSNLDEFYRVRMAAWRQFAQLEKQDRHSLSLRPRRELRQLRKVASRQLEQFGRVFTRHILPELRKAGIYLLEREAINPQQRSFLEAYFQEHILPVLDIRSWQQGEPIPLLEDKQIYGVLTTAPYDKLIFVRLPVPPIPRWVALPSEKMEIREWVFTDDILALCLPGHLSTGEPLQFFTLKLSRDAELYIEDEYSGDLLEKIRQGLERRRIGPPTRLLFDGQMPFLLVERLKNIFQLDPDDLVPGARYHNFSDFMDFPALVGRPELCYPPLPPLPHPQLEQQPSLMASVLQKDVLLHFPYQRWDYIPALIREAADDPQVQGIKITLYRIANPSAVLEALILACQRGKAVVVFIEAKARFDEASNLEAGKQLEQVGAKVYYSYPGIKVHAKMLLITRIDFADRRDLVWLSTGNFNEKTARVYADHGLLSAHPAYTEDVARVFDLLERNILLPRCKHLWVAPFHLRRELYRLMDQEVKNRQKGQSAYIILKMNSLEDPELIEQLYAVARAGVNIRLIIRGICRLIPGVPGQSDNIEAISLVGRFLEHARVFVFANGGTPLVYLASADGMTRNLERRVEIAWPVLDPDLREEVLHHLHLQLADNTKARILDAGQTNTYRTARPGEVKVQAQTDFYEWLRLQMN